jgi:hypothetical protein
MARKIAEEVELLASSKQAWEVREEQSGEMSVSPMNRVNSALKLLSTIDLESYFIDRGTRSRIDNSLAMLHSHSSDNDEKRARE